MTTVLICDDRVQVRDGLARVMSRVSGVRGIELVEHSNLLVHYARTPMDLVLVGPQRATSLGVGTIRALLMAHPRANVVFFDAPDDVRRIAAALTVGACGFLRWDGSHSPMLAALTHAVAPTAVALAVESARWNDEPRLTRREMQVLHGMSEGLTNREIGCNLFLSEDTIKIHARRLFRKLGVGDRAQAVAHGFRRSLIS